MIVRLAKHSGFCFGVRRAIQLAIEAADQGTPVFSLGELIHNPQYVLELQEKGIKVANSAAELHNSMVIVRSHGITKQEYMMLEEQGNTIVDATCPYVTKTHNLIRQANADGYPVVILGDALHPEVVGMRSFGNPDTIVVGPEETPPAQNAKRLCVISQTTQKLEHLNNLIRMLLPNVLELKVYNSICIATSLRQSSSACLAQDSDLMIVIGGRQSSNTKMLTKVCAQYCPTIQIETEEELQQLLPQGIERIGLAAGASTPETRILEVYNKILKINGEEDLATSIQNIPLFKEESC
jgi:(E)-4-hydroxy-3-methyl-but-2-enyl pyrophosphate reductase